ncbi:MAG: hypothetical protein NC115_00140 [Bacteroidales bacterium]|nr:hypothetical protein [Bacteroides sp.]MCM1199215.1 hypothetical protein [Clostridium sp.]MCM1501072.1 hypothetical protein [Bacteroidales bacterium]
MKCVITADIVDSTKICSDMRKTLLDVLEQISIDVNEISSSHIEVYRGDSFQLLVNDAEKGMLCAILIRAGLMCFAPDGEKWDARVSLGLGDVLYENERVTMSDGEAFRLSGRNLEVIGKQRLAVAAPSNDFNEEFTLACAFADDIISGWSKKQAGLMYCVLMHGTSRMALAELYGTSVQNIGKTLRAAKENLILMFVRRFESLINRM